MQNYNGDGEWSVESVVRRYESYCRQLQITEQRVLRPQIHMEGECGWIYPIMAAVIQGIKEDDPACTELGIDFISESKGFPFGMTLKSQAARALRKATLTPQQEDRVRTRVVTMLLEGYLPQEYRFYSRLLRRTGLGGYKDELLSVAPRSRRMQKYVNYVHILAGA
ncbi:MAG TPA: hypothetical protein VLA61_00335 [Ideonella sp.]|uniref:hypothetical protein n=1 Tax=Ideonella sp. TaxID=1929293 RepID=UPI002CC9B319|nr:hypothetical protein [Ideonella sp.]HSI46696.1 hypothetical protein [Ideonella sp.]